jgi:hypothetical protein
LEEWSHLYGAALLRCTQQAILATSWGMFQIMGFNHGKAGFATPTEFANAMCAYAGSQLAAFLRLCRSNNWSSYLIAKDWGGFARHFNGPSYGDNHYDQRLAAAYNRYASPQN